jgi:hypothetical protein
MFYCYTEQAIWLAIVTCNKPTFEKGQFSWHFDWLNRLKLSRRVGVPRLVECAEALQVTSSATRSCDLVIVAFCR